MGELVYILYGISASYAKIAEQYGCEMFIAGCEMVMSEHRETEWRRLLSDIRQVYHGLLSYNTDKYQEHRVNGGMLWM